MSERPHREQAEPQASITMDHLLVHKPISSRVKKRNNGSSKADSTHTSSVRERHNSSASEEHEPLLVEERSDSFVEQVSILSDRAVNECRDNDSGISEVSGEDHSLDMVFGQVQRKEETVCSILMQVAIPFVIAGFGMMAAGLLLDTVQVCVCVCLITVHVLHRPYSRLFM